MMVMVLLLGRRRLLGLMGMMMVVMVDRAGLLGLLLMVVVGDCRRKLGGIVTGGAGVYRTVIALVVHLYAEDLKLLSGVSWGRVSLLEARQGRRAKRVRLDIFWKRRRGLRRLRRLLMVHRCLRLR